MTSTRIVDVLFPLSGDSIPVDHGYQLFSALAGALPALHGENTWGVHPIRGDRVDKGQLRLDRRSFLKVRIPIEDFGALMEVTGKTLEVGSARLIVGIPRVHPLTPVAVLKARLVTIKGAGLGPRAAENAVRDEMALAVRKQLAGLPLEMDPERIQVDIGRRHKVRIGSGAQGHQVVGFAVGLAGLSASASLAIQHQGIG